MRESLTPAFTASSLSGLIDVDSYFSIVTRPFVVGDWEKGTQLPMRIRPYAPPS